MQKNLNLVVLFTVIYFIIEGKSGPIPIKLDYQNPNKGNLEFALQLPNNDTVQIDLSFTLLKISKELGNVPNITNDAPVTEENVFTTTTLQTTTNTNEDSEPKYVTVEEAIESFRQDLIKKESEIAGVIESESPFYRHFKLQFNDDVVLTIRCTYDSNFEKRTLNISCYEYHEFEKERVLSNGEVEIFSQNRVEVEYINARNMKQIYKMEIS